MHKHDLIRAVATECDLPAQTVSLVINTTLNTITEQIAQGDRVVLTGFGAFEVRHRRERRGVDPRTGAELRVPATRTPGFTASSRFKQRIDVDRAT